MARALKLFISLTVPFLAGLVGSAITASNVSTWYVGLEKPFFVPPTWIFGPVWAMLYLLIGVSLYLVWVTPYKESKKLAYIAFGAQLVLNGLWSFVFFGMHAPEAGVVIILVLVGTIIGTMRIFWRISSTAAYLLIPYLLWVGFALALNIAVAVLN
jgi:translocator protein